MNRFFIMITGFSFLSGCSMGPGFQFKNITLRPSEDASLHCFMVPKPSEFVKMSYNFRFSLPAEVNYLTVKFLDAMPYISEFSLNGVVRDFNLISSKARIPKRDFKKNKNIVSIHFKPEMFWPEKKKPLCSFSQSKTFKEAE